MSIQRPCRQSHRERIARRVELVVESAGDQRVGLATRTAHALSRFSHSGAAHEISDPRTHGYLDHAAVALLAETSGHHGFRSQRVASRA
jgi:hypothetical protein